MRKGRLLLVIPIVLIVIAAGWYRRGGAEFLKKNETNVQEYSKYYLQKKDIFESSTAADVDKVFLGDSITDHGEFQEYFPNDVVLNRGISGDTSKGVHNRILEVVNRNPKEVFLLIGANDIKNGIDQTTYLANIENILQSLALAKAEIYIQSILPVNNDIYGKKIKNPTIMEFNLALKETAQKHDVHFVDLHPSFIDETGQLKSEYTLDGLHLNGKGYQVWVNRLNQLLQK